MHCPSRNSRIRMPWVSGRPWAIFQLECRGTCALRLREAFARYDAEQRFPVVTEPVRDNPACECGAILRGVKKPTEWLFGTACTPETPIGSCMVSAEGACAAHWTYGRFRETGARRGAEGCLVNVTQKLTKPHRRKLDLANGRVDLSHGSGGRAMAQLIADIFHHAFDNDWLRQGNDQLRAGDPDSDPDRAAGPGVRVNSRDRLRRRVQGLQRLLRDDRDAGAGPSQTSCRPR